VVSPTPTPSSSDSTTRLTTRVWTRPKTRIRGDRISDSSPEEVVDDVVAHLGVPHVSHLRDDAAVVRDVERGLFPGTNRNAVRRCADAVAAVVDDVASAS
jgi:hypothetical protein